MDIMQGAYNALPSVYYIHVVETTTEESWSRLQKSGLLALLVAAWSAEIVAPGAGARMPGWFAERAGVAAQAAHHGPGKPRAAAARQNGRLGRPGETTEDGPNPRPPPPRTDRHNQERKPDTAPH